MPQVVTYRGTRPELLAALRRVPAVLAGKAPDPTGLAAGVQLRCGVALLSQAQQDFVTMSRGGVSRWGMKWPPLKPATIAYSRRTTAAERKAAGDRGGPRPLLTAAQDRRWKQVYGTRLARLRLEMDESAARARAAQIAWAVVKREGGKTKLGVYGSRQVDVLRDTGRLLRSLSPGVDGRPTGDPDQVFETPPGRVIVGTNVAYAGKHLRGDPAKNVPPRPFWPPDGTIPDPWWPAVRGAAARGLQEIAAALAAAGAKP